MGTDDGSRSTAEPGGSLPVGIERTLLRAATDRAFREELCRDGARAAEAAGVELTAAERTMLDAMGGERLASMIERLPPTAAHPPPEPRVVALGIRPDDPSSDDSVPSALGPAGVRPDPSPIRGTRPGVQVAVAAGVVISVSAGGVLLITGSRPDDVPPATEPAAELPDGGGGAPPDAGPDSGESG